MQINVTKEDIEAGQVCEAWKCPVAHAINRVLKPGFTCGVSGLAVQFICYGIQMKLITLDKEVDDWTDKFDSGEEVEPFSFGLAIPENYVFTEPNEACNVSQQIPL